MYVLLAQSQFPAFTEQVFSHVFWNYSSTDFLLNFPPCLLSNLSLLQLLTLQSNSSESPWCYSDCMTVLALEDFPPDYILGGLDYYLLCLVLSPTINVLMEGDWVESFPLGSWLPGAKSKRYILHSRQIYLHVIEW